MLEVRIHGRGGRPIAKASLHALLADARADRLGRPTFLDLDHEHGLRAVRRRVPVRGDRDGS